MVERGQALQLAISWKERMWKNICAMGAGMNSQLQGLTPFLAFVSMILLAGCALMGPPTEMSRLVWLERTNVVTQWGRSVTLIGPKLKLKRKAPEFVAVDTAFHPVRLSNFLGKPVLISVVPSLDTRTCALQTKRFNEEIRKLPVSTVILTISMDLPFAQKRFCAQEKVDRILVLSDSARRDFGPRYGVLIKERGLLARSVFVIDKKGRLIYQEIVPELSAHPNYTGALLAVQDAAER